MSFFQFSVPTKIIFNVGLSQDFAHEVSLLNVVRLFLITDDFLKSSGLCDPILKHLQDNGIEVVGEFTHVPPDSSVVVVKTCAEAAKTSGAQGFLAIGGGSVIDTAKGANILFTLGGDLKEDYSGAQTITQNLSPLIVIPTTAGTGSEVTEAIVIYDEETKSKLSFVDHHLLPTLAVLDPLLTLSLPKKITAATGLDALTHAVEAVLSVQNNPVSDALAIKAVADIFANLKTAVQNGEDVAARSKMLVAATLAGIAFNHAMVGVVHAVAHSVGALARVHHGTANGIFLPYGLEYNLDAVQDRLPLLADVVGVTPQKNSRETCEEIAIEIKKFVIAVSSLAGLPLSFKEAGVQKSQLPQIASLAADDGASFYNPKPITAEEILPFIERAFDGR